MLRKIPRQILAINIYGYFVVAAITVAAAVFLLNSDSIGMLDFGILALMVAGAGAIWWRFHPRLLRGYPHDPAGFLNEVKHSRKHTLLALESEYCALCMTAGQRINRLKSSNNLAIYRLSVNAEPGRSLFHEFGGHVTPTYVMFDDHGEKIDQWQVILPVESIRQILSFGVAKA